MGVSWDFMGFNGISRGLVGFHWIKYGSDGSDIGKSRDLGGGVHRHFCTNNGNFTSQKTGGLVKNHTKTGLNSLERKKQNLSVQ